MLLFKHARAFFWRFVLSRNYKIQTVAHVGRKSAVVLSGIMEASYSHFFIGPTWLATSTLADQPPTDAIRTSVDPLEAC